MSNLGNAALEPVAAMPEAVLQHTDAFQLSRLSSVLNGLEGGACAMRRHVLEAMRAVREGTYQVDPVQLSRRIVGEAIGAAGQSEL
jgi:hypothetical protein